MSREADEPRIEILDSSCWTAVWVWEVKVDGDNDLTLHVIADTMEHASRAAEEAARAVIGALEHSVVSAVRREAVHAAFIPAAGEPLSGDQAEFNRVIGALDEALSRLLLYAEQAREEGQLEPGIALDAAHLANRNTLKHHAEDMLGAATKIMRLLGIRVNVEVESGGALAK